MKGQQAASRSAPSPHRYHNKEDYRPPTAIWGVIWVKGNSNMKEACNMLAWDMIDLGLTVRWKEYQSVESSAHILLMNVPLVLERGGVESEIVWHLCKLEKRFLKKGILPEEYIGVSLLKKCVFWRQSKQGKGNSKVEHDLSLNLQGQPFQENRCLVCIVEATGDLWTCLGPLWEAFHKMGLCRRTLGCSCLMNVMFNRRATDSDWVKMQRLYRVNVMYSFMLSHSQTPNISVVHNQVKVEMKNGSKPLQVHQPVSRVYAAYCMGDEGHQRAVPA